MVDVYIITDAVVTSSLLALLTIGLSLTYLTTRVPNFAHGTFASVGIYVGVVVTEVMGLNVYLGLIPGFFVGALVAVAQYLLFLRPMTRRNANVTTLMVATVAFDIFLIAILNIFADYLSNAFHVEARYFQFFSLDFTLFGIKGLVFVAPILVVGVVVGLYLLLNRTKFGIAMRATIENPPLAGTIGINTDMVYIASWFLAGGIAGLAGSVIPLWYIGNTNVGSDFFLISIFAAAVVGGVYSINGAILGGLIIGLAQSVIIDVLALYIGAWIIPYQPIIPLIAMIVTLLLAPNGITGINYSGLKKKLRRN
ncbi:MAG TPA: branched-chain amino acid ABC transporter permease [Candidatus Nanoarchaeia archaeon]|nr:branched-chain amino acid ABC transporter permease [Candidatus Nanoarchaeia archaeon]